MKVNVKAGKLADLSTEALVLGLFEGGSLAALATEADQATGGLLSTVLKGGDFRGKANQTLVLYTPNAGFKRLVLIGLGKEGDLTLEKVRNAAGKGATTVRELGVKSFTLALPGAAARGGLDARAVGQASAEGSLMSLFQMNEYRTRERDELKAIDEITYFVADQADQAASEEGIRTGQALNDAILLTRTLVVHPGNVVTPTRLADEAKKMGAEVGIKVTVLEKADMEKLGFGGVLGVNRGSVEPPKFIIMEYNGGTAGEAPLAVIGKGITFDTGGISIKPSEGMDKMKYDMAGGAAAIGIMRALATLKIKRNVVGLVPATDNMPSGSAIKPGDILTAYDGKTVEVLNTDAEGRLVLMDAIAYAVKDLKAEAILDMATLTGACVVALGTEAIGVLGNHQELVDRILASGEKTGDRGWQLPLWKEYNELLRSDIADMKNIGGKEAGTISAACFLSRFAGETPWVHLDIAGTAWTEKEKPYRPKGPTGTPVRAVVDMIENWKPLTGKAFKF